MVSTNNAVNLVVTLVVAGLMIAFLLPIAVSALGAAEEVTVTQNTTETTELQPNLTATLDSVDTTADSATYTINGSGDTATATVNNGSNTTVTVDGADVTISPTSISTGQATTTYEYPGTYGWGGGAAALWDVLRLIMILAGFLFLVYLAIDQL